MMRKITVLSVALAIAAAGSAFAANSLSVTSNAALNGTTKGLEVHVDPSATNTVYVQSNEPNNETHMKVRLWMSAANLDAPSSGGGRTLRFMNWRDNDDSGLPHKIFFIQRQNGNGNNWRLAVWSRNTDSNSYEYAGGTFLFSYKNTGGSGKIQLECEWTKATSGANGILDCHKVGKTGFINSHLSDSARQTDDVQLGFFDFDGFPNGVSDGNSSLYLDEYESYR